MVSDALFNPLSKICFFASRNAFSSYDGALVSPAFWKRTACSSTSLSWTLAELSVALPPKDRPFVGLERAPASSDSEGSMRGCPSSRSASFILSASLSCAPPLLKPWNYIHCYLFDSSVTHNYISVPKP